MTPPARLLRSQRCCLRHDDQQDGKNLEARSLMSTTTQEGRRPRRPSWRFHAVTAAVLAVMLVAVSMREGGGGPHHPGAPLLIFTIAQWLPLIFRSRWPVLVLAVTAVVSALQLILVPVLDAGWEEAASMAVYQPVPVAAAVAAYAVAVQPAGPRWTPSIVVAVILPLIATLTASGDHVWTALVMCNLVLDGAVAGALVAGRRDRLVREAREREEVVRREVEAERMRIARELHDVLAHHLTLVNAQAGVADYLVRSDPDAAATALNGLAEHTRQALDELRATVGLLRHDPHDGEGPAGEDSTAVDGTTGVVTHPPLPSLARLPELLEAVKAAGAEVKFSTEGTPRRLAPGADLAAYRVIQEALTNATKHAPRQPVDLHLHWNRSRLTIRVRNETPRRPQTTEPVSGHGLLGMSERVRAAGGALRVERATSDGSAFTITAELPIEETGTRPPGETS